MATGQPQQVVVMQPMQGQTQVVQSGGGEAVQMTNQPQTVVVVQQQQPAGTVQQDQGDRYPRWAYLIFGIGMFCYHFLYFWTFFIWSFIPFGYGALFFFCGCLPSGIVWLWLICDSTVFCANPGTGSITKMCCCQCINGYIMAIPMAVAGLLRLILWISFFGILADFLNDVDGGLTVLDNVFWICLSLAAFDVGPIILLAIDWWWYYGKFDFDALFGTKIRPLRCAVGESIVVMIVSWAFIAMFEELADDAAVYIWPWIVHGCVSTAILIFAAFLQFSGSVTGNMVNNGLFKFVCWGLGIAQGVLILIIWGYILSWSFGLFGGFFLFVILFLIYGLYYSGMTVPIVWALFSFQVGDSSDV